MNNAFDEKNSSDYEKNTDLLHLAMEKIHQTPTLSATIAELSRITGLHRNAISNRVWPGQKLHEIKEHRKQLKTKTVENLVKIDPVSVLEEKLDNAKRELVFWFTKCTDNEKQIKQLNTNLQRMSDARSNYENMLKQERLKTEELKTELNQLRMLIQ
ncbi:MAG: hypothetical protein V5789_06735 [Colwellia sp.]